MNVKALFIKLQLEQYVIGIYLTASSSACLCNNPQ